MRSTTTRLATALAAIVALVASGTACDDQDPDPPGTLENTNSGPGEQLTISGQASDILDDVRFELTSPELDEPITVFAATETTPAAFEVGDELVVSGTVREFDRSRIEDALAVELEPMDEYDGEQVMVAVRITTEDEEPVS